MAKQATNKSQAIRDALEANPKKTPSEIADELKSKGLKVNAQYVSTIKSGMKGKRGGNHKVVRRRRPQPQQGSFGVVTAALKFIDEAGGLEEAKQALATVEEIRNVLK